MLKLRELSLSARYLHKITLSIFRLATEKKVQRPYAQGERT